MEDKSLLALYLSKVGAGDTAYVEKLCRQIADRLVFIPVISSDRKGVSRCMTLNVCRDNDGGRDRFLLFTSERKLKAWSTGQAQKFEQVSLLGADFCAALEAGSWIVVDKNETGGIALQPEIVQQIAQTPIADDVAPEPKKEIPPSPIAAAAPPPEPKPDPLQPAIELPMERAIAGPGGPAPHSLAQRPIQITPEHLEALRTSVASRSSTNISRAGMQRPVIFSSAQSQPALEESDSDKKKKSLLGFLKSAKR